MMRKRGKVKPGRAGGSKITGERARTAVLAEFERTAGVIKRTMRGGPKAQAQAVAIDACNNAALCGSAAVRISQIMEYQRLGLIAIYCDRGNGGSTYVFDRGSFLEAFRNRIIRN